MVCIQSLLVIYLLRHLLIPPLYACSLVPAILLVLLVRAARLMPGRGPRAAVRITVRPGKLAAQAQSPRAHLATCGCESCALPCARPSACSIWACGATCYEQCHIYNREQREKNQKAPTSSPCLPPLPRRRRPCQQCRLPALSLPTFQCWPMRARHGASGAGPRGWCGAEDGADGGGRP